MITIYFVPAAVGVERLDANSAPRSSDDSSSLCATPAEAHDAQQKMSNGTCKTIKWICMGMDGGTYKTTDHCSFGDVRVLTMTTYQKQQLHDLVHPLLTALYDLLRYPIFQTSFYRWTQIE